MHGIRYVGGSVLESAGKMTMSMKFSLIYFNGNLEINGLVVIERRGAVIECFQAVIK